jgi:hypothetical protein
MHTNLSTGLLRLPMMSAVYRLHVAGLVATLLFAIAAFAVTGASTNLGDLPRPVHSDGAGVKSRPTLLHASPNQCVFGARRATCVEDAGVAGSCYIYACYTCDSDGQWTMSAAAKVPCVASQLTESSPQTGLLFSPRDGEKP